MKTPIIPLALLSLIPALAPAASVPVDLSSWSPLTLDFSGGQSPGNWVLSAGNTSVIQTVNADPSFFLNNLNQTSYSIDGSWRVETTSDDDYMGFVFGYQNSSNFYLFDWKQGTQDYAGTRAAEGMTIKKFTGATGDALVDLSLAEMWENQGNFGDMTVLAQNHGSTKGWANNKFYDFHLDFNLTAGTFQIKVTDPDTTATLWDVTVNDSTFTAGQFGFYNYSQQSVRYAGFEQDGGVIVPVPDSGQTLAMFGLVLGMFGLAKTKGRRS